MHNFQIEWLVIILPRVRYIYQTLPSPTRYWKRSALGVGFKSGTETSIQLAGDNLSYIPSFECTVGWSTWNIATSFRTFFLSITSCNCAHMMSSQPLQLLKRDAGWGPGNKASITRYTSIKSDVQSGSRFVFEKYYLRYQIHVLNS